MKRDLVDRRVKEGGIVQAGKELGVAAILFTYRCTIACKHCCFGCGGARPDVVVGDFNEPPGGQTSRYMARQGYCDAAVVAGQAFRPTGLGGGRGDYIWIDQMLRERLIEYGVLAKESMRAPGSGTEFLSDHFPLWITLNVGRLSR